MSTAPSLDRLDDIPDFPEIEHYWWDDRAVKLRIGGLDGTDLLFAVLDPFVWMGDVCIVDPRYQSPRTVRRPPAFINQLRPMERLTSDTGPYLVDQYRRLE